MKRYNELSKDELSQLTEEEIKTLVELEVAYAGVLPVICPVSPIKPEVSIKAEICAYECFGLIFKRLEDAVALSGMEVMSSEYDYRGAGCSFHWLMPKTYGKAVEKKSFYTQEDVMSIKDKQSEYNKAKSNYDSELSAYEKYSSSISKIKEAVYSTYYEALNFKKSVELANIQYKKYLGLAEQNHEIALKFFLDAYKDYPEIIEAVTPSALPKE